MAPGDAARLYHQLSSFGPDRAWPLAEPVKHPLVLQDFHTIDYATWPAYCKAYEDGLSEVPLPREWRTVGVSATDALAGHGVPQPLDLDALARVLFLSAGVVRIGERPNKPANVFRAAGSAGGRVPMEVYVSARGVEGLDDAVYWYDPFGHALREIAPAAGGEATTLVVTGIPWRTGWQYAERGYRHIYWDSGTMLAQTLALASTPRLWTRFDDDAVTRLVGADGVHEFPVALVALEDGAPALEPRGEAVTGAIDTAPVEFPLLTQTQRASASHELGEPWPEAPPLPAAPPSEDLDAVILKRGSTRFFDASATISREAFEFMLAAGLRGTRVPHFVAVNAVEGVEPGLYRWPDLIRAGDLRQELLWVAWDQDLARDAAMVVIGTADLLTLDDAGYREAQLDAGIVEGRLHIAAYALGLGATGMTFLDSEIEALLGEPLASLLWTCVGVPSYRTRKGGRPGAPAKVTMPNSTFTELDSSPYRTSS